MGSRATAASFLYSLFFLRDVPQFRRASRGNCCRGVCAARRARKRWLQRLRKITSVKALVDFSKGCFDEEGNCDIFTAKRESHRRDAFVGLLQVSPSLRCHRSW